MSNQTVKQYNEAVQLCKDIFVQKMNDYGSAWRILRVSSITDQIFIKAQRIRSIEKKGTKLIDEGIIPEYIGIVNYAIIALIQLELGEHGKMELNASDVKTMFDKEIENALSLMQKKNHDYDEAWREMRVSSLTDLILMKLLRIKQIEDNEGKTVISEGIDANYFDIVNYALFALIRLHEA